MTETALNEERLRFERMKAEFNKFQGPELLKRVSPTRPSSELNEELRDRPFVDKTGISTALEVGPAVVGSAAGAPGGPATMIGFGAGGAAIGRGLSNIARDLEAQIRYGDESQMTLAGQALSMLKAGATDLAFGTAFHGFGRAIPFRFLGKHTGALSPEVSKIVDDAKKSGISIGALNLNKPFYNATSRVAGVIPVIGAPVRTAREIQGAEISRSFIETLDGISPTIDLPRLGARLNSAARKSWRARKAISLAKYRIMKKLFIKAGDPEVVPTEPLKKQVKEILGESANLPRAIERTERRVQQFDETGFPTGITTETSTKPGKTVGFPPSNDPSFNEVLSRYLDLPEFVPYSQMDELQRSLNKSARSRSGSEIAANEFRIITDINAATWDALDSIPREAGVGGETDEIMVAIRAAKRSWGDLKALEETAVAKKFEKIDKNYWSTGFKKKGNVLPDEVADLFISSPSVMRSPEFIDDLDVLVGPENRKAIARAVIHRAAVPQAGLARATIDESTGKVTKGGISEIAVFDAGNMRVKLGLADPDQVMGPAALKKNKQALARLLKGTGTNVDDLDSFLKTVQNVQASPAGDPSTFLTRRIILGGKVSTLIPGTAVLAGSAAGAGAAGGAPGLFSLGVFVFSGRAFSKLISTPGGLKLLREGLKPNLSKQQIAQLMVRIGRSLPEENISIEQ
ncbi:MAG: hypothetical protein ACE5ER_04335 [Nitrospinaceae bacterium]